MSANLDIVGVNEPLLFNLRSSRLEDLVGEMGEVEKVVGVPNVVVKGRRGEMPERSSSISETDWVRGKESTAVSPKKFPCPVKKQNLQRRKSKKYEHDRIKHKNTHVLVDKLAIMCVRTQTLSIFIVQKRARETTSWRRGGSPR
jgi:hypothetical protein